ncbi:MAG: arginine--tRNA ligase [Patescibacteria group bacterium]
MQEKIKNLINEVLKNLEIESVDFMVEHPADLKMGDYATNIAMVLSKSLKQNPREIAEKIVKEINLTTSPSLLGEGEIQKVEIAGAGFINFYLSKEFFANSIKEILEDENFGKNNLLEGKKVMVEYTQPNPFKPFHIGHLMSNSIGESISRLVEYSGAKIIRANYQGDIGLHVAKAIYGLLEKGKPDISLSVEVQAEYIGSCYSFASKLYEEDEKIKIEIDKINKKIYEKNDEEINVLYKWGREVTLEAFETIYKKLGTKFDYYFFESVMAPIGMQIIKENIPEIFEESNGAIVFYAESHDIKLHTRVFITSEDLPTYEAKEIGLTITKFQKEDLDISIVTTAIEQGEYMKVVQKAISLIHPEYESKMKHITHGMIRFAEGKMSSRKGNVITGESLIKDVENAIFEKIKDRDFTEIEKKKVAIDVGVSALKYSILKQAIGGDTIYDFEKSISFEGDSGPYMQYSYARAKSLLEKAKNEDIYLAIRSPSKWEVVDLEKMLYRFPEIVFRASKEFEPHYVANYLIELSRIYNSFYGNTQIINKDDDSSPYKIALTSAFSVVMKNGLYLLGIEAPEKM